MTKIDLPSFIWLWKIAAWSMGLSLLAYLLLAVTGVWMWIVRKTHQPRPPELRWMHQTIGIAMVSLVLLLLAIGIIGTLGHFGSLGHSSHLAAGLVVVALVSVSAISSTFIHPRRPWAKRIHIGVNLILFAGFVWVSLTGWEVVQKYLP